MLQRFLIGTLIHFLAGSLIVSGQINHQIKINSDYSITKVFLNDGNTYSRISLPDAQSTDSIGYPKLPVKYINLIIPAGNEASRISIKQSKSIRLKLENLIEPTQLPEATTANYQLPDFVKPLDSIYLSELPYPKNIARLVHQGSFRGNKIVTIAVSPFQYLPIQNELVFYSLVDISVEYRPSKVAKEIAEKNPKSFEGYNEILNFIVDNKSDLEKYNVQFNSDTTNAIDEASHDIETNMVISSLGIPISCDYIIVTSSELAPEFNEFIAWKRRKGVNIDLVTMEDIASNYTGDNISGINDNAGKLRQFLSDAYDNGLVYALLAGDFTVVPIRYGWNYNNYDNAKFIIPTDLYFSDFDGDWKVDTDDRFGEPSDDNVDFFPEIYVGRLLCTEKIEIRNWIKKTLIYEKNPGNGNYSYLNKAFYTQSDQLQENDQARYIASRFLSVFCDTTIWEEMYNGVPDYNSLGIPQFPTGTQVINEMNNHYGMVSWFGHGGPQGIGTAVKGNNPNPCEYRSKYGITSFDEWDNDGTNVYCGIPEIGNGLDLMTNKDYPSIAYTIACDVAPFDDFNHDPAFKNMAEGFTVLTESGGPHFLGNTRYGWVSSSYLLFEQFVNVITSGTSYNIGIAEATSKQNYSSSYLRYSHNLIGCPETELWTSTPSVFNNVFTYKYGSSLYVNSGVSGSRICVMSALDNGSSYYEVKQDVTSWTFTNISEPYLVSITKHNYIPYVTNPNIYIQNELIYSDKYIYGNYFYAGNNVTTTIPQGPVIIKNGANVTFDATYEVNLENGFEVELGGVFEIK